MKNMWKFALACAFISSVAVGAYVIPDHSVTGTKLNSNAVDNSTLQYTSNQLSIKASGVTATQVASGAITTAKIADGNVTNAKLAALNYAASPAGASNIVCDNAYHTFLNQTVSLTATRPVLLMVQPAGGGASYFSTGDTNGLISFFRDTTNLGTTLIQPSGPDIPVGSFAFIDIGSAGTHSYTLQALQNPGCTVNLGVQQIQIFAYEL